MRDRAHGTHVTAHKTFLMCRVAKSNMSASPIEKAYNICMSCIIEFFTKIKAVILFENKTFLVELCQKHWFINN